MFVQVSNTFSTSEEMCCSIPSNSDTAETKLIFDTMTTFAPSAQKISETLISKKSTYRTSDLIYKGIQEIVISLESSTLVLTQCLLKSSPETDNAEADTYSDTIIKSISDARAAYE